ncbi:ABC transporter substrate-binding protein [Bizionia saleffrena]|uniref:ABC transporter substrate-binding protein n=1 Tax=Bizionia saleffrena TaxID=291189 RepID=A0A8H2QK64_9FLAO|nr:ABC transporter substrate-binding protein [Bizionia saleffrena]TYB77416.1 ABC transporter substrate-binding protein [Bizionia saleffrena]
MKTFLLFLFVSLSLWSCKNETKKNTVLPKTQSTTVPLSYAEGFAITKYGNHSVLEIKSPWPTAKNSFNYVLISKEEAAKTTFLKDQYDGIIITPIKNVVVTSTTHIPALELLNVEETLIGFPGTDYISSKKTRARIAANKVRELGKTEGLNTEVVLDINPDVVVAFGVDGKNKSLETIKKANIPVIYNGDWVEKSPLGKAEWIKFFGVLYNKERQADSIFNRIETDYNAAKKLALNTSKQPSVLSGALHKDTWYLPNGQSTEAQFLKDANTNYLWSETRGTGSLSLNFEVVYDTAKNADIWLSPSYYTSKEALEKANAHYSNFDAFKNNKIYTFANTTGKTGGVTYYELGTARPDLVLKDIIKICHPGVLPNYTPYFFKLLK